MTTGAAPGRVADRVRTIFFGSGGFAVPILDAVATDPRLQVVGVVTTPDAPAGRSRQLTPTIVSIRARKLGLRILKPARLRAPEAAEVLANLRPDLGVLADYGKIVPRGVLEQPRLGILGVHPSRLPEHRGATPIPATILAGDPSAGVSIYRMDDGIDTGPVLATRTWALSGSETAPELEFAAAGRAAKLLVDVLGSYLDGSAQLIAQGAAQGPPTTRLDRDDARLDPTRSAAALERRVRAYAGWPGTYLDTVNGRVLVLRATIARSLPGDVPGRLVDHDARLAMVTSEGRLVLEAVQPAGKREMRGEDFRNGYRRLVGTVVRGTDDGGPATVGE